MIVTSHFIQNNTFPVTCPFAIAQIFTLALFAVVVDVSCTNELIAITFSIKYQFHVYTAVSRNYKQAFARLEYFDLIHISLAQYLSHKPYGIHYT